MKGYRTLLCSVLLLSGCSTIGTGTVEQTGPRKAKITCDGNMSVTAKFNEKGDLMEATGNNKSENNNLKDALIDGTKKAGGLVLMKEVNN